MENNQDDKVFRYTYTGKDSSGMTYYDREEVKKIRSKYSENKLDKLCRLDNEVIRKGKTASFNVGIVGAFILGIAICCALVWEELSLIPGAIIGIVGIICMILAYPTKERIIEKEREKIAPEILRLADEIINETKQEITEN